uniref:Uncharacterized protein n=1 Tax=Arundo donax TaxID=35708 RepID=A0A0A9H4R8_ARUDO
MEGSEAIQGRVPKTTEQPPRAPPPAARHSADVSVRPPACSCMAMRGRQFLISDKLVAS